MSRAHARRAGRVLGDTHDLLVESKWIIWCFEPQHMPITIDLLIVQGVLREPDRPHCVHWSTLKSRLEPEDRAKLVDAEEMLAKAGFRTVVGEGWEAHMRGPGGAKAFFRERFGELDAEVVEVLDQLEAGAEQSEIREWGSAAFGDHGVRDSRH